MNTLAINTDAFQAVSISIDEDFICLVLLDGREIRIPLEFYPKIKNANNKDRNNQQIIGQGRGVYWPTLDEDLSVIGMVLGNKVKVQ